ncbi:PAS domain-containing protein [candidate division KSB1 bacterium]|nr:PAS domain-containing protein [candidate division KSB1 bacterium]
MNRDISMISNKLSILAIGYNYLEINNIQDQLTSYLKEYHFDFAISIRDTFYRLNITNYEIILLDVTSTDIDGLLALQEVYQKDGSIPTIVTVTADRISDLSTLLGTNDHYFVPKDEYFAEGIKDCVKAVIEQRKSQSKIKSKRNISMPPLVKELINAMHDMVAIVGLDGRILIANQKLLEKYNCSSEEIAGMSCYQLFQDMEKPCAESDLNCPIRKIKHTHKSCETVHTRHDNERNLIYQSHISALPLKNNSGKLENVLIAIKEETIPLATQFDKTLLRELINGLSEGLIFCDSDNRIVLVNKAAEKLLYVEQEQLTGKSVFDLPLDKGNSWLGGIIKNNDSGDHFSSSEKFMIHDKWLTLRFVPLFDQQNKYIGGFLYLSEKVFENQTGFDPDLITVSRLFSSKIVAEG